MTRTLNRRQATILGLVVLLGLSIGTWGLIQIGSRQRLWADTFELTVGFPDIAGIERGTTVRVLGMEAGQVTDIQWPESSGDDSPVILKLQIDGKYRSRLHADATATIISEGMIGNRAIQIHPGHPKYGPILDGQLQSKPTVELADILRDLPEQKDELLREIRGVLATSKQFLKQGESTVSNLDQEGTLTLRELRGLIKDSQTFVRKGQDTISSVKQDADALKKLPIVRNYVEDPLDLLVRPTHDRDRRIAPSLEVFEPGTAIIDAFTGRAHLNDIAAWLNANKQRDSEIVVVCFVDPNTPEMSDEVARNLTQKQAEAAIEYLKIHKVHKLNWYTSRKMTPLGYGMNAPPVPEKESLPASRIEVLLFTPR